MQASISRVPSDNGNFFHLKYEKVEYPFYAKRGHWFRVGEKVRFSLVTLDQTRYNKATGKYERKKVASNVVSLEKKDQVDNEDNIEDEEDQLDLAKKSAEVDALVSSTNDTITTTTAAALEEGIHKKSEKEVYNDNAGLFDTLSSSSSKEHLDMDTTTTTTTTARLWTLQECVEQCRVIIRQNKAEGWWEEDIQNLPTMFFRKNVIRLALQPR